jgi:hypothetical protein
VHRDLPPLIAELGAHPGRPRPALTGRGDHAIRRRWARFR